MAPSGTVVKFSNKFEQREDRKAQRPDRRGKRMIAAYFEPDAFRDLKIFVAEQSTTVDLMIHEAVEALYHKYHRLVPKSIQCKLKAHRALGLAPLNKGDD